MQQFFPNYNHLLLLTKVFLLQACLELEPFTNAHYSPNTVFNLTSAPVLFHLERDPSMFVEINKGLDSIYDVDYATVSIAVFI